MSNNISLEKVNNLDIQLLLSQTQELFQKKFVKLLVVTLVSTLVSMCSFGLLIGMMTLNLFAVIKKLDEDPLYEPEVKDLFVNMDKFANTTILFLIFLGIGIVFSIILSVLLALPFVSSIICFAFITPVYVLSYLHMLQDPGLTPVECFTRSFDIVKASPKTPLILGAIMGVILAIPSIFGFLLSIPLHTIAQAFNSCLAWKFYKEISTGDERESRF